MRYLITGGCGFIGLNVINQLLTEVQDCRIRVIDNLSVGKREDLGSVACFRELPKEAVGEEACHRLELVAGDIRDRSLAVRACKCMDAVIHLAANTGVIPSIENPEADCTSNVIGTFNYLEASRMNQVRRFILASSGAVLGQQVPPIHEQMDPHPISPYGASKLCGEAYCSAYYHSYGLETVALRFGNVYGPFSTHKGSVIAKFIKHVLAKEPLPIFGDGNQTRDFVYIEDLVSAILLALGKPGIGGEIFQIATHHEHTVMEVAQELNFLAEQYAGFKSGLALESERKGEVRRNYSDISKARRVLGFDPGFTLREGLEKTFLWFLNHEREGVCCRQ